MSIPPLSQNNPIVDGRGLPRPFFVLLVNQLLGSTAATAIAIANEAKAAALAAQAAVDALDLRVDALEPRVTALEAVDIIAGVGLDGGGSIGAGDVTIDLGNTAVTPGTYGDSTHVAQLTVDQQGRITGVSNVAVSGGGGGGGATTGRYWRLLVPNLGSSANAIAAVEITMAIVAGGSTVCTGGTAIASTSAFSAASNAFDGNTGTFWATDNRPFSWIGYDFGSGNAKTILEVSWRVRTGGEVIQNPAAITIETSDDGIYWKEVWNVYPSGGLTWTSGQVQTFTRPF